ncbi:MAG: hypothetical protein AB7P69_21670 [Candidatus Binatia bacterium]
MMVITAPETLRRDSELRELLLSYFLETCTGTELTDWLKNIGQDARGSVEERRAKIRAHTKYLTMSESEFPAQTENYLAPYSAGHLEDLCERLALSANGSKDALYRRIMREVHYREGWLARANGAAPSAAAVLPFLAWMPLAKRGNYEKDYYPVIYEELQEIFSSVYEQLPVAHGSTLKIDFHVGDPQGDGVGIEVKMPMNNSDVQRALGQLDQYKRRYGDNLILFVLLQDCLKPANQHFMQEELKHKKIQSVFR